jgi:hypothetical protein
MLLRAALSTIHSYLYPCVAITSVSTARTLELAIEMDIYPSLFPFSGLGSFYPRLIHFFIFLVYSTAEMFDNSRSLDTSETRRQLIPCLWPWWTFHCSNSTRVTVLYIVLQP